MIPCAHPTSGTRLRFEQKRTFRPYNAEALKFYRNKIGRKITAQQAQAAIDSLRAQTPSLIWKSVKGEYAFDDTSLLNCFEKRATAGAWPPVDPEFDAPEDADGPMQGSGA